MAGGIRIPPYQPLGVSPQGVPGGGYQQANAAGGDFGQGMGAGLEKLGATGQQAARAATQMLLEDAARDNEAVVKNADVELNQVIRTALFDPKGGYFTSRGLSAAELAKGTLEAMDKARDQVMARLGNDDQRRMFRDLSSRRLETATDQVFRHSMVERQRGQDQASDARVTNFQSDAGLYHNDDKALATSINGIAAEVRDKAQRHGWDAETVKAEIRKAATPAVISAISGALEAKNPARARALLSRFASQIEGAVVAKVEKAVREEEVRQGSLDDAERIGSGRAGGVSGQVRVTPGVVEGDPFAIPAKFAPQVQGAAKKYGVPETVLASLFYNESRYNPGAVNPGDQKGSINPATGKPYDSLGIGQWGEQWAKELGFDPRDPDASIEQTAKALREYADRYGGNWALARLAYGMGAGNVDKWLKSGGNPDSLGPDIQRFVGQAISGKDGAAAIAAFRALGPKLANLPSQAAPQDAAAVPIDPETNRPTLEWQLDQARLITDPERREATISRIRSQDSSYRAQVADRQHRAADAATEWLTSNRGKPVEDMPTQIWSALTPKLREAAREYAKKAGQVETDIAVWYAVKQMATSDDPEVRRQFAAKNPLEWRAVLSDATIKEVVGWQEAIKKGDDSKLTEVVSVDKQVQTYARLLGLDTSPKDGEKEKVKQLAEFHMAAQREFNAAERQTGKKLDADGRDAILKRMVMPVDLGTSFLGMGGTSPRYQVQRLDQLSSRNRAQVTPWAAEVEKQGGGKPTEGDLVAGFGAARNYGVPMDEVPTAIAVLKRNRITVTDDAIGRYWLAEKQRREASRPKAPVR